MTDEMKQAEMHRRYSLTVAENTVERLAGYSRTRGVLNVQSTPSMKLAIHRLMVGSHAFR